MLLKSHTTSITSSSSRTCRSRLTIGVFPKGTSILYRAGYERGWVDWVFKGTGSVGRIALVIWIEVEVDICIEEE